MGCDTLKKSSFVKDVFIATLGIILTKVLGILYVIPFHAIVGEKGGALYSYAYTVYNLFISLSSVGIPLAVSKLVSEYNALGYYKTKDRAYQLAKKIIIIMSIISFVILFAFAPFVAQLIIGDISGGNTIDDISFVVRVAALAILFVASLSVIRGYLQGHKEFGYTSTSQVVEQIVRIIILLAGSYLALNVFGLSLTEAVGIAVFGACGGAIAALLYLKHKIKKNKELQPVTYQESAAEQKIDDKQIIKKIIMYALPFIFISVISSSYDMVDMLTVVKTLVNYAHYSAADAESILSCMTTWGNKLNVIVTSVSTGVTSSLIPHIADSFVKNDTKEVNHKINKSLQLVIYTTFPMAIGLSLLANPVWYAFYGQTTYGPSVFWFTVLLPIFSSLAMDAVVIAQSLNEYKLAFISLLVGFLWNAFMNVPLMELCYNLGIATYRGATISSMIGHLLSIAIVLIYLNRKYKIDYKATFKTLAHVSLSAIVMIMVILLFKNVVSMAVTSRLSAILVIVFYTVIGAIVYLDLTYFDKTMESVIGKETIDRFLRKMHIKGDHNV